MEFLNVNWFLPYLKSICLNEPFTPNTPTKVEYHQKDQNFDFTDDLKKSRKNEEHCYDDFRSFDFEDCSVETRFPPVTVAYCEGYGRFIQASRDIEAGETIFCEPPLVLSPKCGYGPTCLDCFLNFTDRNWPVCERCKCPKCKENCEGNEHTELECQILADAFKDTDISSNVNLVKRLNIILTPLRTYITIKKSPTIERIFESFQSNASERKKSPIGEFINKYVVTFFQNETNLNVDSEFVHRVCGIFDTNAFDVTVENEKHARALFPLASLMNHSCVPNTQHWFIYGYFAVRACVPIKEGESITNSYTQTLWGTKNRINHLTLTKLFKCNCQRCHDLTELGSNLSSIKCQKCKDGLLTPTNSKTVSCTSCQDNMSLSSVTDIVNVASGVVTRAENMDSDIIKKTIRKLGNMIGLQHYTATKLQFIYLRKIVHEQTNTSVSDLIDSLQIIESLILLATKIEPGLTRTRGTLLHYKVSILTELLFRYHQRINDKGTSEMELKSFVDTIVCEDVEKISEECEAILKWDFLLEDARETRERWKSLKENI